MQFTLNNSGVISGSKPTRSFGTSGIHPNHSAAFAAALAAFKIARLLALSTLSQLAR
jgi:hypothetical protein